MKRFTHLLLVLTAIMGMAAAAALSAAGTAFADSTYTVQDGDTLYAIAGKLGVSDASSWTSQVVSMNGMSSADQLSIGQVLKLPGGGSSSSAAASTTSYTAPSGSTGGSTANVSNTTSASAGGTYTVQSGDTLYQIASKLGISDAAGWTAQVVSLNNMSSPDQLSVGQVLKIPGGSSSGGGTTTQTAVNVSQTTTNTQQSGNNSQQPAAASQSSIYNQAAFDAKSNVSSAECQVSSNPTCDYGSTDVLQIPSLNTGDSARCGSTMINAAVNVYNVRTDGAMGIPVADCDVVRQNFAIFNGYGGYPGSGGTTVLAGHVDYHPHYQAIFWNLRQVQPGTEIDYINKDGKKITYSVDWAQAITDPNYDWSSLAKSSSQESLVLITCDGVFNPDTHEYDHRFVAHAVRTN